MKGIKLVSGLTTTLLLISHVALADWRTKVSDDVFTGGHTGLMLGTETEEKGLILDCTKDSLSLSYFEKDDTGDVTEGLPVDLVLKVGANAPIKFLAQTEARNTTIFAIKTEQSDLVKIFLSQLKTLKGNILVGIKYQQNNDKITRELKGAGSGVAASRFVQACEIDMSGGSSLKN
ncbi:Uncharacterised protein [Cedecea neteri]|uniref:Uncharacterized protein n=1 Tax=Cedecea neteri TaxID=158822 RepID=A0A291E0S5_9ENTR|nr:hypothetical protein [Cedecea neteri]ATF92820.1 hypothetical protein CO704_12285 [Cedecea neteri]ATF93664.1 hypothetical protein CO704_16865 [Cedecea neteri]SQA96708.1 Uncharacterised protein [Cedecea neteri]SQC93436.1 Uncharacterised protein [Cedecea neteri]